MTILFVQHLWYVKVLCIILKIPGNIHKILVVNLEQMQQQTYKLN